MRIVLNVFPIALLVAYSQLMVKWRATRMDLGTIDQAGFVAKIIQYLLDPAIFSAYVAAFLASFVWLFVVTKLPLVVAFPVYIGVTFVLIVLGSWFFLDEGVTIAKLFAIGLILAGIAIGVRG